MSREPCQDAPPDAPPGAVTPQARAGDKPPSQLRALASPQPPAVKGEPVRVDPHQPVPVADDAVTSGNSAAVGRSSGQRSRRPSLGGGIPAKGRELGAQGRLTIRRLLEAGLAEFDERGFQAVRVDDVVRRAKTSHGTFYLYFANKDDLFRTLLQDALHDMQLITDDFPVVTPNDAGRAALRHWIQRFTDTYAAHATVIRILSQADIVGEEVYGDGLRLLFRLSEAITQGMTAATTGRGERGEAAKPTEHAELTALACLMMLERINYLLSVEVRLPRDEMIDRLSAIIYAAFHSS
ncbi:MAG TPA: TetR family transcriptional regulator [Streptosporangiaceae bacterium]|jgi:AcrR family transcriptional regulator|nr:TetR family transcriptional regulator [Streptosporangiaceae bacterium]